MTSVPSWTPPGRSTRRYTAVRRVVRLSILFAATYPERVSALVLYGAYRAISPTEDYPARHARGDLG